MIAKCCNSSRDDRPDSVISARIFKVMCKSHDFAQFTRALCFLTSWLCRNGEFGKLPFITRKCFVFQFSLLQGYHNARNNLCFHS